MAEVDFPSGDLDATVVHPVVEGYTLDKSRVAFHIADPYVLDARLRLASVGGVYRLPVSNPAVSDELITQTGLLRQIEDQNQCLRDMTRELRLVNHHLSLLTKSTLDSDDMKG